MLVRFLIVRNGSEHSRGPGSISDDPCISCELGASEPSTGSEKAENKPDENRIQTNSHDVSVPLVSLYECVKDKYSHIFYLFNIWILCSVMCVHENKIKEQVSDTSTFFKNKSIQR